MSFAVFVDGDITAALEDFSDERRQRLAAMAINKIAKKARAQFARRITAQVNLPSSYVAPSKDRLYVSGMASPQHLETAIVARTRATSLARYVTSSAGLYRAGVSVNVGEGTVFMRHAFLMNLRAGSNTDTAQNLGLAVRVKPGTRLRKSFGAKRIGNNLYALYGPSVAQVFENNAGTGEKKDYAPEIAEDLYKEFTRLLGLK